MKVNMTSAVVGRLSWAWITTVALLASAFILAAADNNTFALDSYVFSYKPTPTQNPWYPVIESCHDHRFTWPICKEAIRECPAKCPDMCYFSCPACKLICPCEIPGSVCHDPRFVGGDGNTFLFHGRKNADFCLVSDANLHINAHFIGKRNTNASRDFTWVQALGIRFDNHRLYLGVKKTATWDDGVDRLEMTFDAEPVRLEAEPSARWRPSSAPALSITRSAATNSVAVQLEGKFRIIADAVHVTKKDSKIHSYGLTLNDSLAHLNVAFKFYSLNAGVHGVLGQTYRPDYISARVDMGAKIPVMGGAAKYSSSDIFATDCAVARFTGEEDSNGFVDAITEPSDAVCAGGKDGAGLVCKK